MTVPSSRRGRPRDLRASDADRDAYAEVLETAYADGRLDSDGLDQRSGALWAATTIGALDDLVRDLVPPDTALPRAVSEPQPVASRQEPAAGARPPRVGLLVAAVVALVVTVLVVTAIVRSIGGGDDGGTGPADTIAEMFTAEAMTGVITDMVEAAGTTEFEEIGFYGEYAVASVLGAPGGDRMARLDWRDGDVEVEPDAAAVAEIDELLFDPTQDIDVAALAAVARTAAEQTGVADAESLYMYIERDTSSGDHEIQARAIVSNDYQNGSLTTDNAGNVITADGPGVEPDPLQFLDETGFQQVLDAVETRIGGSDVLEMVCYGEYVTIKAPPEPGAPVVASFSYQGGPTAIMDATVPSQPDDVAAGLFSLDELDPAVVATLVAEAPERTGITEPESIYVYVQRSSTRRAAPVELSVYVTGRFDSGRVLADLTGRVIDVY